MCKNNTCLIIAAISLILGVVTGIAFFSALLPGIAIIIVIGLILAVVGVMSILLVNGRKEEYCLCENGTCLVVGVIGTTITGIIASAVTIVTASIPFALLIGLFGFFVSLTILSLGLLLLCMVKINCSCGHCMKD